MQRVAIPERHPPERALAAAARFSIGTAQSLDGVHVRALSGLSLGGAVALAILLQLMEAVGLPPMQAAYL
eukprot:4617292-Lingulodinium_polyedra.AAC.1